MLPLVPPSVFNGTSSGNGSVSASVIVYTKVSVFVYATVVVDVRVNVRFSIESTLVAGVHVSEIPWYTPNHF